MFSILLSLASATVLGSADFVGGIATKRAAAVTVVLWSNAAGLLTAVLFVGLVGGDGFGAGDLVWGALAGLAGSVGAMLLYHSLAHGTMSVVAPTTAAMAAILPVLVGVGSGETVSTTAAVGLACGIVAIPCVSVAPAEEGARRRPALRTVAGALAAGAGFGLFFVLLSRTGDTSGLWPLVAARCASLAMLAVLWPVGRWPARLSRPTAGLALLSGALDMFSSVLYLVAVREGYLSVAGLLASLYPISTLVLARVVLRERATRVQWAGVGLALAGIFLLAAR
ncbi:DMT family transporter [Micromonospora sp. WMMC241]|uniref:DMT family transporter n=1 Tax=Micromonospora sp. WMMC241 TaxID=3015159 RepID=UPI0022B6235E|nr:DMT family transporter [Micromonospora sp. WMMC241]MCZ7440631.1 DMT family transporter [Micromonospora sp. WMMC241]